MEHPFGRPERMLHDQRVDARSCSVWSIRSAGPNRTSTISGTDRLRGYPGVDEESLVRAVQDLLPTRSAMVAVTGGERRFMAHAGVQVTQEAVSGAVCRLVARRILQAAQTMDTGAVVDLLGVQRTRVQHLLEAGDLYAYRDGRRNRFRCGSSPMTDVRCRACERCWPRWGLRTGRWSTGPWQPRNPTFPGPVRWTRGTGLPAAVIPRWWSSWPVGAPG